MLVTVSALTIGGLISGARAAVSGPAAEDSAQAGNGWSGTVKVVEDIDHTFEPGNDGLIAHVAYHDEAVYTLSGATTPEGLYVATMRGSGVGRYTGTKPGSCVPPGDPYYQWSYDGPATVSVTYASGRYVIVPQGVPLTYTIVRRDSACGAFPDQTMSFNLPAPIGLAEETRAFRPLGQSASQTATSLSGTETLPFAPPFAVPTLRIGTATLTWDLTRPSQTPAPGNGRVVGAPAPGRPPARVKVPGSSRFDLLTSSQSMPPGTTVDVSNGAGVSLSAPKGGKAVFYGEKDAVPSVFVLRGVIGGFVELRLVGGGFKACAGRLSSAMGKGPERPVRRLWGKGNGSFRTKGRYASAAVRGTWWLTADYCDRTLVSVKQGATTVRDEVKKKTLTVKAGKSYSAFGPGKRGP